MRETKNIRAALFIDGTKFTIINNYYGYVNELKKKFDLPLLFNYFQKTISKSMDIDPRDVVFSHRHLYMGVGDWDKDRFNSEERVEFSDAGITTHTSKLKNKKGGGFIEKGVDGALMLDAFELVLQDEIDVLVLITGDADFVPLVLKTKKYLKDVFLFYWDIDMGDNHTQDISTANDLNASFEMLPEQRTISQAIDMGYLIEKKRVKVFKEEERVEMKKGLPEVVDQITRSHQGRIVGKRGYSIFINPSTGGNEVEFKTDKKELGMFITGKAVEYNLRKGGAVDLRLTDP